MDGTLCDYMGQLKEDMKKLMSPYEPTYDNLYDESKPWLKDRMDLIKSQPGWWLSLKPLTIGMELYDKIKSMGFKMQILTKGPTNKRLAWKEKGDWIDKWLSPDVPLNVVGEDKDSYYGHILVEDYPRYLGGWLKHRPRGLGILIDDETNRDFIHPNAVRYTGTKKSWENIEPYIKAVLVRENGKHWAEYLRCAS